MHTLTQHVKGTTNSGTRPTYFKYTDFSTTYHRSAQLAKKDLSFQRQSKDTKRYTKNTLYRRKIEMVNARLRVQQFTHPLHPNSSYRLSYLLRQFFWVTRKNAIDSVDKVYKRKNRQDNIQANISLFRKVILSQRPAPIKLLVLLGSPSCRPLLLWLLRRTHELLANSGLL